MRSARRQPGMPRHLREAAASVDAPPALTPVLGDLFTDLSSLGSSPRRIVNLLRQARVGPRARVIDVGCGKGGAAVEVAARLGARVVGIDAVPAFIAAAEALASRRNVGDRCEFRAGDYSQLRRGRFDAALMIGVAPADRCARILRRLVRPGGVYVIDDAFFDPTTPRRGASRVPVPPAYQVPQRDEIRAAIEATGDTILREVVPPRREIVAMNQRIYRILSERARRLGRERPSLRPALREFLRRQRAASAALAGPIRPAVWLVRRNNRGRG